MTHNENSDDGLLQTAAKYLKELFKMFITASNFWPATLNEIELYNESFSSDFYKSCYSTIAHNTLERLLLC